MRACEHQYNQNAKQEQRGLNTRVKSKEKRPKGKNHEKSNDGIPMNSNMRIPKGKGTLQGENSNERIAEGKLQFQTTNVNPIEKQQQQFAGNINSNGTIPMGKLARETSKGKNNIG